MSRRIVRLVSPEPIHQVVEGGHRLVNAQHWRGVRRRQGNDGLHRVGDVVRVHKDATCDDPTDRVADKNDRRDVLQKS